MSLIGFLIIFFPLLLLFFFKNRIEIFARTLVIIFTFHTTLSILTQILNIFSYNIVFIFNIIFTIFLSIWIYKKNDFDVNMWKSKNVFLLVFLASLIVIFQLSSLHFNYTGTVNTINGPDLVNKQTYTYPYFSDEWVAAAYADYAIENKSLPIFNPLNEPKPIINFLFPFHSLIAEIFLILNLNPVYNFAYLAIGFGFLVCFLSYVFLRTLNVSLFSSVLVMLFIPYITNGANLPGIWFLLPFIVSYILYILTLILYLKKDIFYRISFFLSLLFYPPMIVFLVPTILFLNNEKINLKKTINTLITVFLALLLIIVLISIKIDFPNIINLFFSLIVRSNLVEGIPSFAIYNILPILTLPFIFIGLYLVYLKKINFILFPSILGLFLWFLYNFTTQVYIIEYSRVVVITSLLLILFSGFGFDFVFKKISKIWGNIKIDHFVYYFKIFIVILFIISAYQYPNFNRWSSLTLDIGFDYYILPAPPINNYLNNEDLYLFENIKNEKFLAPPWKGLVIGVATDNYPQQTKSSTISVDRINFFDFFNLDCVNKKKTAEKNNLNYYYGGKIECDGFQEINNTKEGLYLYKIN